MENSLKQHLHEQGFRMTPQRWVIISILKESGKHLTPVEIYQQAQQIMPGITEATVYRILNFLTNQKMVLAVHIGNGQFVYESAERDHHHLICRSCGQSLEISHELLDELYRVFRERTNYHIDSIHTTFFGFCPNCQNTNHI